jgi:hypothetical protein
MVKGVNLEDNLVAFTAAGKYELNAVGRPVSD